MGWLVLLFTVLPIVDLWLLLQLGESLGFWPTLGMTVTVAVLGGWLGKREGLKVLAQWRRAMSELRMPEDGLVSGVLVVVGAALLMAPGVLTDVVGLTLLFPVTRRMVAGFVKKRLDQRIARAKSEGRLQIRIGGMGGFASRPDDSPGIETRDVIDAEAEVVEEPREVRALPPAREP